MLTLYVKYTAKPGCRESYVRYPGGGGLFVL